MAMEGIFVSGTSGLLKRLVYIVQEELGLDLDRAQHIIDQLERLKNTMELIEAVTCDAERKQVNDAVVKLWLIKLKEVAYDADDILDRFFFHAVMPSRIIKEVNPLFLSLLDQEYLLPHIISRFDRLLSEMFKSEFFFERLFKIELYDLYPTIGISNTPSQGTWSQKRVTSSYVGESLLRNEYDNLSSHLKQCFSYFSLFPKDWKFDRETLFQMWMAEGFLDQLSNGGTQNSLEDIGNEYFNSLLSCSFFQNVKYDELGDIITFKIHNHVHDFALSVVGRHEVTVLSSKEYEISNRDKMRRLQLVLDEKKPEISIISLCGRKLRTIFCNYSLGWQLDANCSKLRVIHLAGVCNFTLPIDYLRHLRYLCLINCEIKNVSFSDHYLLQTLSLSKCSNVHLVLEKIGGLEMLRHLSISCSDVTVLPESIFTLRNLQSLDMSRCNISVLPISTANSTQNLLSLDISHTPITQLPNSVTDIYCLRRLEFHHCHNLKALPSNIGDLTQLRSLNFEGTGIADLPDSISRIFSLQRLNFRYCKDIKALPINLGALTQLRSLNLEGSGIIELPDSICRIYNLERLEFKDCSALKALPHEFGALTKLRSLNLEGTEITELPESLTSNLWKFKSVNIRRLEVLMPYLVRKMEEKKNAPTVLRTRESSGIKELAGLSFLRVLEIRQLENVRGIVDAKRAQLRYKQNLRELSLKWEEDEANTIAFMVLEGLRPHSNLEKLVIENFGSVEFPKWMGSSSINCLPHLVELYLSNCNRCDKLPAFGMLPCLKVLWIYGMMSIKCLSQDFYYDEEDFKEEEDEDPQWLEEEQQKSTTSSAKSTTTTTSFPSLTRLELGDMDNLEEWAAPPPPPHYVSFPVLETLCIIGCCELTSIPDFRLYTSLQEITIEDCDRLNHGSPPEVYHSPNSLTTNRYLVKEITSGTSEDSGIQDIAAPETKFLHIRNLENVRGGKEVAERAKLKDMQQLEDLYLSWNSSSNDDEYIDRTLNDGLVLADLLPHPNLKILTISGFRGLKLPSWMGLSNYLPHLVEIYFFECNSCKQLPALGMLPCLGILQIKGMNLVQSLAEEFYYQQQENISSSNNGAIKEGEKIDTEKQATAASSSPSSSGISVFPSLVELSLTDMSVLEEWAAPHHSFNSFPSLEKVIISGCLRLKSTPFTCCSSLKSLELHNTNDEAVNSILARAGGERTSLASLSIRYSPQLQFFPVVLLPNGLHIQTLDIAHCSNFQGFCILDNDEFQAQVSSDTGFTTSISSLCSLKLFDCPAMTLVPDLREWTSLAELWIKDCDKLKESFSYSLKSLKYLKSLYVDRVIDLPQK